MDVVVRLNGGLGNQLFQYAAGEYLAAVLEGQVFADMSGLNVLKKRRISAIRELELDGFNVNCRIIGPEEIGSLSFKFRIAMLEGTNPLGTLISRAFGSAETIVGGRTLYALENQGWAIEQIASRPRLEKLYLSGYWSSGIKHLETRRESLLQQLVPRKQQSGRLLDLKAEISETKSTVVHVRRGDYVTADKVRGRNVTQVEYFKRGVQLIRDHTERVFIFSDDIDWCKAHLDFGKETRYVSQRVGESASDHLYLMSRATNFVIPNSTFSWWSAWLSTKPGKRVIRPDLSVAPGVENFEHLFPKEWQTLDLKESAVERA